MKEITSEFEYHTYKVQIKGLPDGFMVDIIKEYDKNFGGYVYDVWLYYKNYGVKENMFGLPEEQKGFPHKMNLEDMENIVEANLCEESYIKYYYEEHMEYNEKIEKYIYSHPEGERGGCPFCGCSIEEE